MDNVSKIGRAKCITFESLDNEAWNYSALSDDLFFKNAKKGIKLENNEMVIKATQGLERSVLEHLDLGSVTMSEVSPEERSHVEEIQTKRDFLNNAIQEKLLNLKRQGSIHVAVDSDLDIKPTFTKRMNSFNLGVHQRNRNKGSLQNKYSFGRLLTKENGLDLHINSETDLDKELNTKQIIKNSHIKKKTSIQNNSKVDTKLIFFCKRGNAPEITATFSQGDQSLTIKVFSKDGCPIELSMLQLMSTLPVLTAILFSFFGFVYLFLGFLFKKYFKVFFILLTEVFLYFSLYFIFIESLSTSSAKIISSLALLLVMVGLGVATYFFNFVFFLKFAFLSAINFGLITKLSLQEYSEFFYEPFSEWWLIVAFTIIFSLYYIASEELFIITATSILGSSLGLISLKYFNVTDYDFLFNTQVEKFERLNEINPENVKFAGIYFISVLFGMILQWVIRRKYKSNQDEIDILNQSGRKVAVNFDNI